MIRVFSGSCLSLDEVDHVREVQFVERPHLLGPGVDYFTEDGQPLRPQLCAHTLNKVFSGSALDLNDLGGEADNNNNNGGEAGADGNSGRFDPTVSSILAGLQTPEDPVKAMKQKTVVLVVGAGGYAGSYVVRAFLEAGYTVRAAVDDINDQQLNAELYALHPESVRRLLIVGMNLLDSAAYRDHVRGTKYVVHCGVSAMFTRESGDSVVKTHTEAVQALFDAVRTYGKQSVKRVIILGSGSAFSAAAQPNATIDETILKTAGKGVTEAVPAARIAFVNESIRLARMVGVELTVLLPTIMLGPSVVRESSEGMRTVLDLSYGSAAFPFAPRMFWNFVDVRDVAEAAVKASESEAAKNECFILSNATLSMAALGRLIRKSHPHLSAPIYDAPTALTMTLAPLTNAKVSIRYLWKTLGVSRKFDNSKAKNALAINFTAIDQTVADSVHELIQHGYLPSANGTRATANYSADGSSTVSSLAKIALAVTVIGSVTAAAGYFLKNKNRK